MSSELENLKKIEKFLNVDMDIKQRLINIAPSQMDSYSQESVIDYSSRMFEQLDEIEYEILQIINAYDMGSDINELVKGKIQIIRDALIKDGYSFSKLKQTYQKAFSNMSKELVEDVKNTCVGYLLARDTELPNLLAKSKTINEILHVLHSYIVNNEEILQALPKISQKSKTRTITTWDQYGQLTEKEMEFVYTTLYGVENEIAEQIYMNIDPEKTKIGETIIVALKNKVLMMVRDHGHALTLEIDAEDDKALVKYFIPKICNVEMVNQLKGVTKVTENSNTTTGVFECDKSNIGTEIIGFIQKVPTDRDLSSHTKDVCENCAKKSDALEKRKISEMLKSLLSRKSEKQTENNKRKER